MRADPPPDHAAANDSRLVEDVDAIALVMADGLQSEYVQLEPKPFRVRWTTARQDSIVAQFGSEDVAVVRRLRVPRDRWAFMIPLSVNDGARWNGHAVHEDDIIVCPPRSECLAFDPPLTEFAIVTVGTATTVAEAALPIVDRDRPQPVAAAGGLQSRTLRDDLRQLRNRVEAGWLFASPDGAAPLSVRLAECLAHAGRGHHDVVLTGTRSRIVGQAEAFFKRHMSEGVSVAQLSTVTGVSERSLRNAFYDVYTTSPKRYMKLYQLHQVRRALRAGVQAATVTEVATGHGFFELGRFAGAYKSLFGEAPSETLSKARNDHISGSAVA